MEPDAELGPANLGPADLGSTDLTGAPGRPDDQTVDEPLRVSLAKKTAVRPGERHEPSPAARPDERREAPGPPTPASAYPGAPHSPQSPSQPVLAYRPAPVHHPGAVPGFPATPTHHPGAAYPGPAPGAFWIPPNQAPAFRPVRVESLPGTEFGVAYLGVPPTVSGLSVGSLVAGIASLALGLLLGCIGLFSLGSDSGPIVAGAFAILTAFVGAGGVGLGIVSLRQTRSASSRLRGRHLGTAGVICGGLGVLSAVGGLLFAFLMSAA